MYRLLQINIINFWALLNPVYLNDYDHGLFFNIHAMVHAVWFWFYLINDKGVNRHQLAFDLFFGPLVD